MNSIVEINLNQLKLTGVKTYDTFIIDFNRFLDGRNVTFDLVNEYIEHCKIFYKPSTLGCIKSALKNSIKKSAGNSSRDMVFLVALEMAFKNIKTGKSDKKVHSEKVLNQQEIDLFLSSLTPRLNLIVRTLSISGIRISELCNIKLDDCNTNNGIVFIQIIGKGRKQRRIFLPAELYNKINVIIQGHVFLFETMNHNRYSRHYLWREINKAGKKILNKDISPHTFRHSFCTNVLLEKEKSLKAVSQYVGHSSTSITADMYIHDELKPGDLF